MCSFFYLISQSKCVTDSFNKNPNTKNSVGLLELNGQGEKEGESLLERELEKYIIQKGGFSF